MLVKRGGLELVNAKSDSTKKTDYFDNGNRYQRNVYVIYHYFKAALRSHQNNFWD